MRRHYAYFFLPLLFIAVFSCSKSDDEIYIPIAETPDISPVKVDLTKVPYAKLSDYHFFQDSTKNHKIKDQEPELNVLPFTPASVLFTDYALKKRFVWLPEGTKATYNGDNKVLELPVGAALVKTFYYDNVQNISHVGGTRLVETRVMIRGAGGWIFADYVWNAEQTEAYYDLVGSFTTVTWKDQNNVEKTADYRIPSLVQCNTCHKNQRLIDGALVTNFIPIGIKPQNLNFDYNYGSETKNQLTKWIEKGYLENNFSLPTPEHTVIDYNDASKSLELRARSYVDSNCSHCHMTDRHCDYRPMRFAFSETGLPNGQGLANMGVCVDTQDIQDFPSALNKIVTPGIVERSMMFYRLNTTDEAYRMPLHGRTIIHEEGVALIRDWINSLEPCH